MKWKKKICLLKHLKIIAPVYITFEQIRHCQGLCRAVSIFQTLDYSSLKFGTAINKTLIVVEIIDASIRIHKWKVTVFLVHSMWTVKNGLFQYFSNDFERMIHLCERKPPRNIEPYVFLLFILILAIHYYLYLK